MFPLIKLLGEVFSLAIFFAADPRTRRPAPRGSRR